MSDSDIDPSGLHTKPIQPVLTVREAAECLRIGRTKMYKLINDEEIKCIKIGRKILIPAEFLKLFIEKNSRKCYNSRQIDSQSCYRKGDKT